MLELKDICYEHIADHFYYGNCGDFKLIIDTELNLFNATKLCADNGKKFKNWKRNKDTQELFKYYKNKSPEKYFSNEIRSNKNEIYNKILSGTYLSKEFILDLTSWISCDSYFKASNIVKEQMQTVTDEKEKEIDQEQTIINQMQAKINQMQAEKDRMQAVIDENEKEIDQIQTQINQMQAEKNRMQAKINQMQTVTDEKDKEIDQKQTQINQMQIKKNRMQAEKEQMQTKRNKCKRK